MKNIQKLEEHIMGCWNLVDDLEVLKSSIDTNELSKLQIGLVLSGLIELYKIKFSRTFEAFEAVTGEYYGRK